MSHINIHECLTITLEEEEIYQDIISQLDPENLIDYIFNGCGAKK